MKINVKDGKATISGDFTIKMLGGEIVISANDKHATIEMGKAIEQKMPVVKYRTNFIQDDLWPGLKQPVT